MLETVKSLKESKKFKSIKKDLVKQLELMGANTPTFLSQVDTYMAMWVTQELLIDDIEQRGTYIAYDNGGGQSGTRKNDSVADQIKVNGQMQKVLDALGIRSSTLINDDDDEL